MLPNLNKIERLSQKVWRILGLNPGPLTLQGTNTYLVGEGKKRFLIDTGINAEGYKDLLAQVLRDTQSEIDKVVLTHNHPDHVRGIKDVLELTKNCSFHKLGYDQIDHDLEEEYGFKYSVEERLEDNQIIHGDGFSLRVISTPGHCGEHVCFYLVEEKTLFTGDFVLSGSSNVIRNFGQQMDSFRRCLDLDIENVLAAHGEAVTGKKNAVGLITTQMNHRNARHSKIAEVVKEKQLSTIDQIVEVVYPGLSEYLIQGAKHNISVHIEQLQKDGIVEVVGENFKYIGGGEESKQKL